LDEANQMRRREFVSLVSGALTWRTIAAHGWAVASPICARAQAAIKRIGFLRIGPPPSAWIEALRQGLRELGYTEGKDIAFAFGLAPDAARLTDALAGFDRMQVDVIFASGTPPLLAAKQAQGSVPVVFVAAVDPVATGLVASLARPGGKITGLTNTQADITGKQLQLLRELLPGNSKIAVMVRSASQASARYLEEAAMAARASGAQLQVLDVADASDIDRIIGSADGTNAVIMTDDAIFTTHRKEIAELAMKHHLAFISTTREFVNAGGLLSYGPNTADLYRRAATHIDKVLKGARPEELPVEQPTKFELAINLKTAKVLGISVPAALLARADEVIE
jgi:putative tryptophan/tyrosine transport system substrate-binding protein